MSQETCAGIDVSKRFLDVAVRKRGGELATAQFANDAAGHRKLVAWLTQRGQSARVVLEPTGAYSLEVALALHHAARIAVMVANPRAIKQFAGALRQRSKTDVLAAVALQEYATRMPFVAWEPPPAAVLELRAVGRRIAALVVERTREQNRLEAATANRAGCSIVRRDLRVNRSAASPGSRAKRLGWLQPTPPYKGPMSSSDRSAGSQPTVLYSSSRSFLLFPWG